MIFGRHHNADGIDVAEKIAIISERTGVEPGCDFFCQNTIDINHPNQLHIIHSGIFFSVKLAQVSNTDHTYANFVHLSGTPVNYYINKGELLFPKKRFQVSG